MSTSLASQALPQLLWAEYWQQDGKVLACETVYLLGMVWPRLLCRGTRLGMVLLYTKEQLALFLGITLSLQIQEPSVWSRGHSLISAVRNCASSPKLRDHMITVYFRSSPVV